MIFLHRQSSLQPYNRLYRRTTDSFLDNVAEGPSGSVVVRSVDNDSLLRDLKRYHEIKEKRKLLLLPFSSVNDYLHSLRAVSRVMQPLGHDGLLYLAAAVSDFFIPVGLPVMLGERGVTQGSQSECRSTRFRAGAPFFLTAHHQQTPQSYLLRKMVARKLLPLTSPGRCHFSSASISILWPLILGFSRSFEHATDERLSIQLDPVPKFLRNLVESWAPKCMVVSYKLETDPNLLLEKARSALSRYRHDLVIGNILATRKREVVFVGPDGTEQWIRAPGREAETVAGQPSDSTDSDQAQAPEKDGTELESLIVPALILLHDRYIQEHGR